MLIDNTVLIDIVKMIEFIEDVKLTIDLQGYTDKEIIDRIIELIKSYDNRV